MSSTLLILDEHTSPKDHARLLKAAPDADVLARKSVSPSTATEQALQSSGRWHPSDAFRTAERSAAIYDDTVAAIDTIFEESVGGITLSQATEVDGLSLRRVLHTAISLIVERCVSDLESVSAALEALEPDELLMVSGTSDLERAASFHAKQRGVPVRVLSPWADRLPGGWRYRGGGGPKYTPMFLDQAREKKRVGAKEDVWSEPPNSQRPGPGPGPVNTFFPLHYRTDVGAVLPILDRAQNRMAQWTCKISAEPHGAACQLLAGQGRYFDSLADFVTTDDRRWVDGWMPRLKRSWLAGLDSASASGHYCEIVRQARPALVKLADDNPDESGMRTALWWFRMLRRACREYSPKLMVITDEATPFYQITMQTAQMEGVATLHVPHAAMGRHMKYQDQRADVIAVAGQRDKEWLTSLGTDPDRVVVTGRPSFDTLAGGFSERGAKVRQSLPLKDPSKPLMVYTALSGRGVTAKEDVVAASREILSAARQTPEVTLVIKLHPQDDGAVMRSLVANEGPKDAVVISDVDLHGLLFEAAVVVTLASTTGLEAIMLERPIIVVNLSGKPDLIAYVEDGGALGVYEAGGLHSALNLALSDADTQQRLEIGRRKIVVEHAFKNDGGATDRVVDLMERMA